MQQLDKQFIDNRWVASHGSRRLAVVNPYTEQTIAEVTAGDSADVDAAVAAARRALPAAPAPRCGESCPFLRVLAPPSPSAAAALTSSRRDNSSCLPITTFSS